MLIKSKVADRRSYRQFCGVARALDLVGERWTLLIVRDLLIGPRRYGELLESLDGMTSNLLAKRLREMEAVGLLERVAAGDGSRGAAYDLSEAGRSLEPVVMALGAWGWRWMDRPRPGERTSLRWALLALRRRYRGGKHRAVIELSAGDERYQVRLVSSRRGAAGCAARQGTAWGPADVRARGDSASLRALLSGGASSAALLKSGKLEIEGGRSAWQAFVSAFGLEA
jgi:DNA-binding HxlR family transcriptional regulator